VTQMYYLFGYTTDKSLKTLTVGSGFKFPESATSPQYILPDDTWTADSDGGVYTSEQIVFERSGIADTYRRGAGKSGTWGTCAWKFSYTAESGDVTISAGTAGSAASAPWKDESVAEHLTAIAFEGPVVLPQDCTSLFEALNITSVDFSGVDTSGVTSMKALFKDCTSLESLDNMAFDTSSVTDMSFMFQNCQHMPNLDMVATFNTAKVTDMTSLFDGCIMVRSLDVSGFNTARVTSMESVFDHCAELTELDVSAWDTSNVTNMSMAFEDCRKLQRLNLGNLNTAKVTTMRAMFFGCQALKTIDCSGFDTRNVTDMGWLFCGCESLDTLDLSGFESNASLSEHVMLNSCSVKTLKLGDRFDLKTNADLPEAQWFSTTAHSFFTSNQIMSNRRKVADTYIKFETTVSGILSIPDEVTSIGSEAFRGVEDTLLVIPRGVVQIADDAFDPESILAVYRGSSAEEWALEHGFKCLVME